MEPTEARRTLESERERGLALIASADSLDALEADNEYLPTSPEEIAAAVHEAYLEGASVAHLHLRDDGVALYGFPSAEERDLFRVLLGATGVGPKLALAILGGDVADMQGEGLAAAVGVVLAVVYQISYLRSQRWLSATFTTSFALLSVLGFFVRLTMLGLAMWALAACAFKASTLAHFSTTMNVSGPIGV